MNIRFLIKRLEIHIGNKAAYSTNIDDQTRWLHVKESKNPIVIMLYKASLQMDQRVEPKTKYTEHGRRKNGEQF